MKLPLFIDFKAFWEGLGRILGGFGERLGRVWENLGRVLEVFREGLGRIWGDATDQNEVGPADRAQRLNKKCNVDRKLAKRNEAIILPRKLLELLPLPLLYKKVY